MKTYFGNIFTSFLFTAILLVAPSVAQADVITGPVFGKNAMFQDVFFGNYTGRDGDIEGHAAIKGDVDAFRYGFGSGQQNLHTDGPVLVVGGNVKATGSGVFDGNGYIGGTSTTYAKNAVIYGQDGTTPYIRNKVIGRSVSDTDYLSPAGEGRTISYNTLDPGYIGRAGTVQSGYNVSNVFDFDAAEAELRQISSGLFSLNDNITGEASYLGEYLGKTYQKLELNLTQAGLNVITLDVSLLNQLGWGTFSINSQVDSTLLINVTDVNGIGYWDMATMIINGMDQMEQTKQYYDFDGSNILFNVQDSLRINSIGQDIYASVLAVDSDFTVMAGHISGQVFGRSAYTEQGGEFHAYYTFDDKHLPNATPEPATILIFGIGMVGGAVAAYRRKRAVL